MVSGLFVHSLHGLLLLLRLELRAVVQVHNLLIANMHNHVYFAVAVHVVKLKGNGCLVAIIRVQRRAGIDTGVLRYCRRGFQ